MSLVIQFLEARARDTRPLDAGDYAAAVAALDDAARDALLARDPAAIAAALGLPPTYACAIATPDHDEPSRDDEPADGDEETPASPEAYAA